MENFAELMQRLLEVQHGARRKSAELIEEDERLMERLQERVLAGKSLQTKRLNQHTLESVQSKIA